MSQKILITYASRGGSTVGVAEAIAETLMDADFNIEILPMQQVEDVTSYDAVVAGSGIQAGQWLPEAIDFLWAHQANLETRPFAAFMVCMTLAMKNKNFHEGQHITAMLDAVRAILTPVSEGYFAGVLDISKVPSFAERLKFRISVMSGVWSEGDHRDWDKIHAWAQDLAQRFVSVEAT